MSKLKIEIPKRFEKKISGNNPFENNTKNSLIKIQEYLYGSPAFFTEYTDHGIRHVNRVLCIADKLIPNNTLKKLTEKDICVLILSISLHDLGMFIKEDGLRELLFGDRKDNKIEHLDKKTWGEEWAEYKEQVRRYPEQKLKKIYGDTSAAKIPNDDIKNLSNEEKLTCGDFLRQQHHRLAHEIAIKGFLGNDDTKLFDGFSEDYINLIGVVARSHGMEIRKTEDYIKTFGGGNTPSNIKIYYLMCVLRLADYLDAGEDRAHHIIDNMQQKVSPLSKEEWSWNQAIDYDNYIWDTTQFLLSIKASPKNSSQFVKIEDWLKSLQRELDLCWAVLGEFYRYDFELSLKRITSNILDECHRATLNEKFSTKNATIGANPNIVKLMVEPLYGNNPSFGVRELLQNSVDACNERERSEEKKGVQEDYIGKVDIKVDTNKKLFTITDNGIGMTEDTIINYFLQAGSTLRTSENWTREFKNNENKSEVRRSGRFGVGFLATYLIGKSMKVTTRNINDTLGYTFSAKIDDDKIDIKRVECNIGTKIEIEISDDKVLWFFNREYLKASTSYSEYSKPWNGWFYFKKPIATYYLNEKNITIELPPVPSENEKMDSWFKVNIPKYKDVQWRTSSLYGKYDRKVFCNGIAINNPLFSSGHLHIERGFELNIPWVSFVDYDGVLPINLQRDKIKYEDCFDLITQDVCRYCIAEMLCKNISPVHIGGNLSLSAARKSVIEKGYFYNRTTLYDSDIIYGVNGFVLDADSFLVGANVNKILYCENKIEPIKKDVIGWENSTPICFISNIPSIVDYIVDHFDSKISFYLSQEKYNALNKEMKTDKLYDSSKEIYSIKKSKNYYYLKFKSNTKQSAISLDFVEKLDLYKPTIKEHDIEFDKTTEETLLSKVLYEYLGEAKDYWIPYDFEERKKKFPKAFKELAKYRPNGKMELIENREEIGNISLY